MPVAVSEVARARGRNLTPAPCCCRAGQAAPGFLFEGGKDNATCRRRLVPEKEDGVDGDEQEEEEEAEKE